MPFKQQTWHCYIIDSKKCTYSHLSSDPGASKINFEKKLQKFIGCYNEDNNYHIKLPPIQFWQEVTSTNKNFVVESIDSGIFVIQCLYSFTSNQQIHIEEFRPTSLREKVMVEALQYSDNIRDMCILCGDQDDFISWTNCVSCERWLHNSSINSPDPTDGDYICKLCREQISERL